MGDAGSALWLSEAFAAMAEALHGQPSRDQVLQEITELAATTADGAQYAGVTLLRRGRPLESPAYTHPLVPAVDLAQTEAGEGPCLLESGGSPAEPVVRIENMTAERRWPRFAGEAARLGIGSMLSCRLTQERDISGRLNLLSTEPGAFSVDTAKTMAVLATHAAIALSTATAVENLSNAVASRQVIGEATGILMERHRVTSREAFGMLVRASQSLNVKLREIALHVVSTGQNPAELGPADFAGAART
ncbi:GAF and ANTAR domain-containing protein [Streptomyces sp. NPDC048639]|uniref:GAF and ANTAR domain-containing protein n=1 Tax=Streptomyces sp. NPDC048639 TaxID=3365581 RepID=UPI00371D1C17